MSVRNQRLSFEEGEHTAGNDSALTGGGESPAHSEENDQDGDRELTKSEAFKILRNARRRAVLSYLNATGGAVELKELTRYVAANEYEVPADELSSTEYKRVYNALYQCHLPKMDELDLIEFDQETNVVSMQRSAKDLIPYVDDGTNASRLVVNLSTAAIVILIAGLWLADFGPVGQLYAETLGILLIVSLVGFALLQLDW